MTPIEKYEKAWRAWMECLEWLRRRPRGLPHPILERALRDAWMYDMERAHDEYERERKHQ